jgi:AraC-like DNA-binding protein
MVLGDRHHQMSLVPLTRSSILLPISGFLESVGAPVERLLASAGLPPSVLADSETPIPTSATARLLARAARREGIENLGLLSGRRSTIDTLGIFGRQIRRSQTLGEALEATVRNHRLYSSNGRMWLVFEGERVAFCQAFNNRPDGDGWAQASHYILMLMLGIIRLGAGKSWHPAEVHLQTAEARALRDAEDLSTAHLEFSRPATAIVLPRALLDRRLQPARRGRSLTAGTVEEWRASAPAGDFVGSVLQVVDMFSAGGYPTVPRTADALGMSVRTLQRQLALGGVTHEMLVRRRRFAEAARLLEKTDTRIIDIALDLGYSDHAHFTRAFRRWVGLSPHEFRSRARGRPKPKGRSV